MCRKTSKKKRGFQLARGHRQREREREDDDDDDDDGKTRVGRVARSVVFVFLFFLLFEEPVWSQISSKSFEIVSDSSSGRAAEL